MLHREIGNGTLNGTQFNGNKRKQLEFVNVTSTNQVVSVLYYCIHIYLECSWVKVLGCSILMNNYNLFGIDSFYYFF